MLKNVTITLTPEAALWARKKAAEADTSVSRLVGKMIEDEMRRTDDYWAAFREWKSIPLMDLDADNRLTREEIHERR